MATLYELDAQLRDFDLDIDEETGEILNGADLEKIELAFNEKVENYALWIKNLKSDAEAYKREKESFQKKEQSSKKKAEWLKTRLEEVLEGKTFKTDRVSLTYRKSESVQLDDDFNDERFITFEPKISKTDIKNALKSGEEVQGARLVENQNLQIK